MNARDRRECEAWNRRHPVGTRVKYWSLARAGEPTGTAVTIAAAGESPIRDAAVVRIRRDRGGTDYIALTHVEPINGGGAP